MSRTLHYVPLNLILGKIGGHDTLYKIWRILSKFGHLIVNPPCRDYIPTASVQFNPEL